ncbi:glycosyltransferase family 1 protein, partial [Acinetobacter baumannii]|nr:glycosyltransferase family 1 protein [Acinetobacter baumannii]
FRINVRFWLIGGELIGDKSNAHKNSFFFNIFVNIKKNMSRACLSVANTIYAKEQHHIKTIKEIKQKLLDKVEKIYNCVSVLKCKANFSNKSKKDFLYANAVIETRNVISLIQSFANLRDKNISFKASIYGFNSISNDVYTPRGTPYSE